jgi:hypothetical protein
MKRLRANIGLEEILITIGFIGLVTGMTLTMGVAAGIFFGGLILFSGGIWLAGIRSKG